MTRTTRLILSAVTLMIFCPLLIIGAIHTPLLRICAWAIELTDEERTESC